LTSCAAPAVDGKTAMTRTATKKRDENIFIAGKYRRNELHATKVIDFSLFSGTVFL
jgi:hypothetical protein